MKKVSIFKIMMTCLLLAPSAFSAKGQEAETYDRLGRKELMEDFQQFRKILEENHCCLYEYSSKTKMDSMFDYHCTMITDSIKPE